jgi:hypothetical protein
LMVNVTIYTIHGSYGYPNLLFLSKNSQSQ